MRFPKGEQRIKITLSAVGSGVFRAPGDPVLDPVTGYKPNPADPAIHRVLDLAEPPAEIQALESQLWDYENDRPVGPVSRLPYVEMVRPETGECAFTSRNTPFRLASENILEALGGHTEAQVFLNAVPARVFSALADPVSLLFGFDFLYWKPDGADNGANAICGDPAITAYARAFHAEKVGHDGTHDLVTARSASLSLGLHSPSLRFISKTRAIGKELAELVESLACFSVAALLDKGTLTLGPDAVFEVAAKNNVMSRDQAEAELAAAIDAYLEARPKLLNVKAHAPFINAFGPYETTTEEGGMRYSVPLPH